MFAVNVINLYAQAQKVIYTQRNSFHFGIFSADMCFITKRCGICIDKIYLLLSLFMFVFSSVGHRTCKFCLYGNINI